MQQNGAGQLSATNSTQRNISAEKFSAMQEKFGDHLVLIKKIYQDKLMALCLTKPLTYERNSEFLRCHYLYLSITMTHLLKKQLK